LAQTLLPAEQKLILSWLQTKAIPIKHLEAGNGFADLQPLKKIFQQVKVVGLGEATHGTREFFQMKHRLVEFLVKEMNFNGFVLEAPYASCQSINEYVLYGKGDRASVLTAQGYSVWDNEEFSALLDWMHTYNQAMPEEKKVRFYGLDFGCNEVGRKKVLTYLQKHSYEKVASTDSLFTQLALADEKWLLHMNEYKKEAELLLPSLQSLGQYLLENKAKLVNASSLQEYEQMLKYITIMEQTLLIIKHPESIRLRTQLMGQNALALMESHPASKFIISAQNGHISVSDTTWITVGTLMREKLGHQYYGMFFETNQGTYQARGRRADRVGLSSFTEIRLPSSPTGSLPWYLAQGQQGNFILNLRDPITNPVVERWWNSPQEIHDIGWIFREVSAPDLVKKKLHGHFDGLLFIEKTTRARPTKNAWQLASQGKGVL
jgi:erythromycin esterase